MAWYMQNLHSSLPSFQLVTFDLFDTIFRLVDPGQGHARRKEKLRALLSDFGVGSWSIETVDAAYRAAEKQAVKGITDTGLQPRTERFFDDIVEFVGGSCTPEITSAGAAELQKVSVDEDFEFADRIIEHISKLASAGVELGIVSNNFFHAPNILLEKLQSNNVLRHFTPEAIAFSSVEGIAKPNPLIFSRVCTRMNVAPSQVLHIGDSAHTDYEGAKTAGIKCVLVAPWSKGVADSELSEAFSWIS